MVLFIGAFLTGTAFALVPSEWWQGGSGYVSFLMVFAVFFVVTSFVLLASRGA